MNKTILVADSGGTQTDWCYIDKDKVRTNFTTKSFHPSQWNDDFFHEFDLFWKDKPELKEAHLYFYGAGCLNEKNQQLMKDYFRRWGFKNCKVESDILGACHALLGNEKGNVAILGTGSVFCKYDGTKIISIHGGLGYLLGDEGSGYYFGKLVLSNLLNEQFDEETTKILTGILGGRNEIISKVYGVNGKSFVSSVVYLIKDIEAIQNSLNELHELNLNMFVSNCLLGFCDSGDAVSLIGTYGYNQQDKFIQILQKNNYYLIKTLQYPIDSLADYIQKEAF